MTQRIPYRTPDGLVRLWTQDEIDTYLQHSPFADTALERSMTPEDEAKYTVKMLYDLIIRSGPMRLDHGTTQELLIRLDNMIAPLKGMIEALEVKV